MTGEVGRRAAIIIIVKMHDFFHFLSTALAERATLFRFEQALRHDIDPCSFNVENSQIQDSSPFFVIVAGIDFSVVGGTQRGRGSEGGLRRTKETDFPSPVRSKSGKPRQVSELLHNSSKLLASRR